MPGTNEKHDRESKSNAKIINKLRLLKGNQVYINDDLSVNKKI